MMSKAARTIVFMPTCPVMMYTATIWSAATTIPGYAACLRYQYAAGTSTR